MSQKIKFSEDKETLTCGDIYIAKGNVFELGGWQSYLGGEDLTYTKNRDQDPLYAYDFISISVDKMVVGYFIGYDKNLFQATSYANIDEKVYEIIDFSVDCGDRDEECGELLLEYAKRLAAKRGCSFLALKKREEFFTFNDFCMQKLGWQETAGELIAKIEGVTKDEGRKLLFPKDGESVTRETLYFLKATGFTIGERVCRYSLADGEEVTVDRASGGISYPPRVEILGETSNIQIETDRAALHYLCVPLRRAGLPEKISLRKTYQSRDGKHYRLGALHGQKAVVFLAESVYRFEGEGFQKNGEKVEFGKSKEDVELLYLLDADDSVKFFRTYSVTHEFELGFATENAMFMPIESWIRKIERQNEGLSLSDFKKIFRRKKELEARFSAFHGCLIEHGENRVSFSMEGKTLVFTSGTDKTLRVEDEAENLRTVERLKDLASTDWASVCHGDCDEAWRVEFSFSEGEPLVFSGSGAYPRVWKRLLDLIDNYNRRL